MLAARQVILLSLLALPAAAIAHPSGGPAVAWPNLPHRPGELADREFRFTWIDTNFFTPTGTVSIDWFYTRVMPPTYNLGVTPDDLEGTPIVLGVDEEDRTDAYVWNTSTVAPGAYWIWSRVNDLPGELSIRINAFSRGVVVVAHPGDQPVPAVAMTTPQSPFELVDGETYAVSFEAFDPAGDGKVTLEAMQSRDGSDAIVIARDLAAVASATVSWRIADVAPGDWILRATLVDGGARRTVAYGRFILTILPRAGDGGVSPDAALAPDAAALAMYDGGVTTTMPPSESCATSGGGSAWSVLALVLLLRRRAPGPR